MTKSALKIMSKPGLAAAIICGLIPLIATGWLFTRDLQLNDGFSSKTFYAIIFFTLVYAAFQLLVLNPAAKRFEGQGLRVESAPLPIKLRIYYGAALGLIAYLCLAGLLLLYMYFFT